MRILVADDDAVSRSMMQRLLTQSGYEVSTASNGIEAVEHLACNEETRLLLLDWMMPGLDGPEVCRAIRTGARRSYAYIILLTSKDTKDDMIAGLEAGADDYLTKPCNSEELRARLRTGERILKLEDNLVSAREEMRFRATHDGMTKLLNRSSIIQRVGEELGALRHTGKPFATLLCDVDHFKKINDTHGHPVGDEVLREVAIRLKKAVRATDAVGRFGGEEFLVVLEGCISEAVTHLSDNLCKQMRSLPFETSAGPIKVSMSVGALHVDESVSSSTVAELLHTVDTALYQAKKNGRDCHSLGKLPQQMLSVA